MKIWEKLKDKGVELEININGLFKMSFKDDYTYVFNLEIYDELELHELMIEYFEFNKDRVIEMIEEAGLPLKKSN